MITLDLASARIEKNDQCSSLRGLGVVYLALDQELLLVGGGRAVVMEYSGTRVGVLVGEEFLIVLDGLDQCVDALSHFVKRTIVI